ncbi:hypothetical protein SLEP1_g58230 [Rubroshorea leprosula]|uniref:Reverse transcriptase Ty1/copia-type domain-containing protein n=1 Tax=Rubroshorea leprosula TaxID=152421 RepID=A0AAV5MNM1_9ROSI|nr:hypothetical protein SLEP1_g58230 [Rubroshorea leprosula]
MSDEFNALVRQGTWELVPHTDVQNVIGCKWVFRVKRNKESGIDRYKARLVAKGFHQRPGTEKPVESIISLMGATFSIKDLGCLNYFLGVNAIFTNAGLFLSQAQYIRNQLSDAQPYRQLVGSLQYLARTRPDISFAVNKLSQFLHAPSDVHWQAAKRILWYLKDWVGDKDTYHSTTGYVVFLDSNPISWRACKQKTIARSSTKAEYRALAAASFELVWIKHLLHELGHPVSECPAIYCDNVGATHLSSNSVMHTRMKHIAIDLHFVWELVDHKVLRVSHISTVDQLVDGLTKPLSSRRFAQLQTKIGVTDGSSILRGRIKEITAD